MKVQKKLCARRELLFNLVSPPSDRQTGRMQVRGAVEGYTAVADVICTLSVSKTDTVLLPPVCLALLPPASMLRGQLDVLLTNRVCPHTKKYVYTLDTFPPILLVESEATIHPSVGYCVRRNPREQAKQARYHHDSPEPLRFFPSGPFRHLLCHGQCSSHRLR